MRFIIPPENAGQIIENAYCLYGDYVYKRVYGRDTRNCIYFRSKSLKNDEGDYWNGAPRNKRWERIYSVPVDHPLWLATNTNLVNP